MKKLLLGISLLVSGLNMFGAAGPQASASIKSIYDNLYLLTRTLDMHPANKDPLVQHVANYLANAKLFAREGLKNETEDILNRALGLPGSQHPFNFVIGDKAYPTNLGAMIRRVMAGKHPIVHSDDTPASSIASSSGASSSSGVSSSAGIDENVSFDDIVASLNKLKVLYNIFSQDRSDGTLEVIEQLNKLISLARMPGVDGNKPYMEKSLLELQEAPEAKNELHFAYKGNIYKNKLDEIIKRVRRGQFPFVHGISLSGDSSSSGARRIGDRGNETLSRRIERIRDDVNFGEASAFDILGVTPSASDIDLATAYNALMKQLSVEPDPNKSGRRGMAEQILRKTYNILRMPLSRAAQEKLFNETSRPD